MLRKDETGSGVAGVVAFVLVFLLLDAAALYGIVWLAMGIGKMMGWWQ